jgi:hypothetical protein
MTENEWLACTDPAPMLNAIRGKTSARKLRLFTCACCRRIWWSLSESSHRAVEAAELYADGLIRAQQCQELVDGALAESQTMDDPAVRGASLRLGEVIQGAVDAIARITFMGLFEDGWTGRQTDSITQTHRLRNCIFGNPFCPQSLDTAWQALDVILLAQAGYEERTLPGGELGPARLAILADALEEAGYTNTDLLTHLRGPGPHVRGCWAVDLLTGRQ